MKQIFLRLLRKGALVLALVLTIVAELWLLNRSFESVASFFERFIPESSLPWWLDFNILPLHWPIWLEAILIWLLFLGIAGSLIYVICGIFYLYIWPILRFPWTLWEYVLIKREATKILANTDALLKEHQEYRDRITFLTNRLHLYEEKYGYFIE